jgi:hypothetical protein
VESSPRAKRGEGSATPLRIWVHKALKGIIKETLGTELHKLADFDKEVARLKKELQSVSAEMLEHRQRGAVDAALAKHLVLGHLPVLIAEIKTLARIDLHDDAFI